MWDPAQKGAPYIAYAIANVDFTTKTRAATDLTQTFRVLAVLLKEGSEWKIVQTQWSHGGPIR
jgi:ketosteroid isomerase-like protein